MANGRVDLLTPFASGALPVWLAPPPETANNSLHSDAIKGIISATPLSELFFSVENIEALHQGVRYRVYTASGSVVGRQSDSELSLFMRAAFLREARFEAGDPLPQVRALNASVLTQVVANVLTNLTQWQQYRRDASRMPIPLEKGLSTNRAGTRIVELPSRF